MPLKSLLMAFFAPLFCIWLLRPLAMHIGLVDRPNERKLHVNETPLIGGIAIYFGFCLALLLVQFSLEPYRGLLAGACILLLMGVVDDFRELNSRLRLCGQVFAALCLTSWGNVTVTQLGDLFFHGSINLNLWSVPFTLVAVVMYLNAFNMIDGQDGLAGGIGMGQAILLWVVAYLCNQAAAQSILAILMVNIAVFLGFNWPFLPRHKAQIFLGDAGSTVIAFILSWFAVQLSQMPAYHVTPMTILWIISFPIFDFMRVLVTRILAKRSVLEAGRDHIHHFLQDLGAPKASSTSLLCLFSLLLGCIGILLQRYAVKDGYQYFTWLGSLMSYVVGVLLLQKKILKRIKRV